MPLVSRGHSRPLMRSAIFRPQDTGMPDDDAFLYSQEHAAKLS